MKKTGFIFSLAAASCAAVSFAGTPTIDGTLDAGAGYTVLAGPANPGHTPWGPGIDASAIYYTTDATNVYLFVQANADTGSNNGIMLLLNTSKQTGAAAGTALGGNGGHAFGMSNTNWKMDFEVDRGYVGNTGGSPNFYVDERDYVANTSGYFGNPGLSGTSLANGETMAFNDAGNVSGIGSSTGWEIAIPRSDLGGATNSDTIQAFAIVVSGDAYFSHESAPQTLTSDPGHNADFGAISGNQSSSQMTLPVSMSKFTIE